MGQSHAVSRGPHQTARAEEGEGCRHAVKEFVRHSTNEPRVKRATKKDGRVCARTFFCVCVFVFVFLCRKKPYARVPGHFHSIRFPPPFRSQVDAWRTDERLGAGKDHHNKDQTKDRRDVDTLSTHESQKNQPKKYHHACIYIVHNSTYSSLS